MGWIVFSFLYVSSSAFARDCIQIFLLSFLYHKKKRKNNLTYNASFLSLISTAYSNHITGLYPHKWSHIYQQSLILLYQYYIKKFLANMQAFSYKIFISHQIHIPILSSVSGLQLLHIWLFYLFLLCGSALQISLSYYRSTYRQWFLPYNPSLHTY